MSHVGKRPRENRARRAEGAEGAGLSASFTTAAACLAPEPAGLWGRETESCVCLSVYVSLRWCLSVCVRACAHTHVCVCLCV